MKTDTKMAKPTGLFLRGGVHQLRVLIPLDVQAAYDGRTRLTFSLRTSDPREARLLAAQEKARLLEEFELKRQLLAPQRLDMVTPEMALELAARVHASVLRVDDVLRDQPATRAALFDVLAAHRATALSKLTLDRKAPPPSPAPAVNLNSLEGLTAGEAAALSDLNAMMDGQAGIKLAQRNLQSVLPLVKEEAHKMGLTFDPQAPGAKEALMAALKAYRKAWHEVSQRDAGEIIDTPVVATVKKAKPKAKPTTLRDVYLRWKESKPRSQDSIGNCHRAIVQYEQFTGNPPIDQLTREQGDGFRTWLQHPDRKTTSKTARDRLTWVKSVLKFASRDLGLLPNNPWEGLDIAFKTTNKRRPWTDSELETFFTQPLHIAYKLPKDKKAGADAAYWIPLLGLYTGARVGELAQLRLEDVDTSGDIPVLSITDEGEGQSVKSEAGIRKVPIHSELIRLGFLDYVTAMKDQQQTLLWPVLATREGKPGGYFSHWFGGYRRYLGFGTYPDFHCMRHTVRSQLAEAEVSEQMMDTIVGHEVKGSTGAKVYTHRSITSLKKAIEVLNYPAIKLERVYRAN